MILDIRIYRDRHGVLRGVVREPEPIGSIDVAGATVTTVLVAIAAQVEHRTARSENAKGSAR